MIIILLFFQLNIPHGQHENEMEEIPEDVKEGLKSQNKDRVIYELRAEVRYWIKSVIPKQI